MSASEKQHGKISRVTFNAALKPIMETFEQADATEIYDVVRAYLHAWLIGLRAKESTDPSPIPHCFEQYFFCFQSSP
jgi:hypothetical protein